MLSLKGLVSVMKKEKKNKKKKVSFTKSIKLKLLILSVLSVLLALVPIGVYVINTFGTDIDKLAMEADGNLLICAGASVVILLMMGYLISSSVTSELRALTRVMDKASELDFSENKDSGRLAKKTNEIGFVNKAVADLHGELADIMSKVRNQRENVSKSREELLQIFSELAQDVENIRETVEKISLENAGQSQCVVRTAEGLDGIGTAVATEMSAIESIKESTGKLTELVSDSEVAMIELVKINEKAVGAINAVTEQTDTKYKSEVAINDIVAELLRKVEKITLLSLNASSEAARAGACGRDFGLVAAQIRNVSEEATNKVNDIEEIINELLYHSENRLAMLQGLGAASQLLADRLDKASDAAKNLKEEIGFVPDKIQELSGQVEIIAQRKEKATENLKELETSIGNSEQLKENIGEQIDIIIEGIDVGKEDVEVLESWCKELDRQTGRLGE